MGTTTGHAFYDEQLRYLAANDVDGLIDNHYNEGAVLSGVDFDVRGRAALKEHFRTYLKKLGNLRVLSTDAFHETEDTIFFEAQVLSDLGPAVVFDAFVMENGKISYHFTGVK